MHRRGFLRASTLPVLAVVPTVENSDLDRLLHRHSGFWLYPRDSDQKWLIQTSQPLVPLLSEIRARLGPVWSETCAWLAAMSAWDPSYTSLAFGFSCALDLQQPRVRIYRTTPRQAQQNWWAQHPDSNWQTFRHTPRPLSVSPFALAPVLQEFRSAGSFLSWKESQGLHQDEEKGYEFSYWLPIPVAQWNSLLTGELIFSPAPEAPEEPMEIWEQNGLNWTFRGYESPSVSWA